jgi:hypothetical protein
MRDVPLSWAVALRRDRAIASNECPSRHPREAFWDTLLKTHAQEGNILILVLYLAAEQVGWVHEPAL